MDNVNLALAEKLLLIAQSLSTASDTLYSQNHPPLPLPSGARVYSGDVENRNSSGSFLAFELFNYSSPLFFFPPHLVVLLSLWGNEKPVSFENQTEKSCPNALTALTSLSE